jgi:hypothetical protein
MMTVTEAAQMLRKHLFKHWNKAETWTSMSAQKWAGGDCLMTFDGYRPWTALEPAGERDLVGLLREDGKDAVLAYLDTLILGGIE